MKERRKRDEKVFKKMKKEKVARGRIVDPRGLVFRIPQVTSDRNIPSFNDEKN